MKQKSEDDMATAEQVEKSGKINRRVMLGGWFLSVLLLGSMVSGCRVQDGIHQEDSVGEKQNIEGKGNHDPNNLVTEDPNDFDGINAISVIELEASAYPGSSNTRLAAGSVTMTSDRDYTFLFRGKCNPGGPVRRDEKSIKFSGWRPTKTINKYTKLLTNARTGTTGQANERKSGEQGYKKLFDAARANAMKVLADHDCGWFTVLKDSNVSESDIWDIRMLEMEITHTFQTEIEAEYGNISEAEMCQKMNQGMMGIFGRESGTVFDTNYYSGHAVLKEGLDINNPREKKSWADTNRTMAALKVAVHTPNDEEGLADFTGRCKRMAGLSEQAEVPASGPKKERFDVLMKAWVLKCEREINIKTESTSILADFLRSKDPNADYSIPENMRDHLLRLKGKLNDGTPLESIQKMNHFQEIMGSDEIEMMAMNRLYEKEMMITEGIILDRNAIEGKMEIYDAVLDPNFAAEISGRTSEEEIENNKTIKDLKGAIKRGEISREDILIRIKDLQSDLEPATKDLAESNMKQLMYANEPYFAHGTIMHVVGGVQMNKGNMKVARQTFPLLDNQASYDASVIENGGDGSVKEYNHLHHQGNGHKFFFKGSKYVYRQANAMVEGLAFCKNNQEGSQVTEDAMLGFKTFESMSQQLLFIRGGSMTPDEDAFDARLTEYNNAQSEAKKDILQGMAPSQTSGFIRLAKQFNQDPQTAKSSKEYNRMCDKQSRTPTDTSKMKACILIMLQNGFSVESVSREDVDTMSEDALKEVSEKLGSQLNVRAQELSDRYFELTVH